MSSKFDSLDIIHKFITAEGRSTMSDDNQLDITHKFITAEGRSTMRDDNQEHFGLDYLLVLENETDVIGEKILRGFNVNFDELGNIIRHNHGQTYIQMSRPRSVTNKGSK